MTQRINTDYVAWQTPVTQNVNFEGIVTLGSNYVEKVLDLPIVSGNVNIDLSSATTFTLNLNSNISNVVVSNIPSSTGLVSFVIVVSADGTQRFITWPDSFRWPDDLDPLITSQIGKKDIFVFFTLDNGNNWQSIISGQNL
jgi:hypothetical protein